MSDLISVEDAEAQGASASPYAMVVSCDERFRVPYSAQGSNVLRCWSDQDKPGVMICENLVTRKPLVFGQAMILVYSKAPLLGFYNAEPGVICPAYGKPVLDKAWKVTVGATLKPVVGGRAFVYESVVMHLVGECGPMPEEAH